MCVCLSVTLCERQQSPIHSIRTQWKVIISLVINTFFVLLQEGSQSTIDTTITTTHSSRERTLLGHPPPPLPTVLTSFHAMLSRLLVLLSILILVSATPFSTLTDTRTDGQTSGRTARGNENCGDHTNYSLTFLDQFCLSFYSTICTTPLKTPEYLKGVMKWCSTSFFH
ncbi:MAG: hypothetical protein JOS17DRAFT_309435 [Linnemannia elongata]|nr:MAG: hypothetical protein JOS17DRAFT_309435 [Linnemannia elongata]